MNIHLLHRFQCQIGLQCRFIILAHDQLRLGLGGLGDGTPPMGKKVDHNLVWYGLQNIMSASVNINNVLCPSAKSKCSRDTNAIKDSLGITATNSFCTLSREVRNALEHFDERLDEWAVKTGGGHIIDMSLHGNNSGGLSHGLQKVVHLRNFDYVTGEVTFWDEKFNVYAAAEDAKPLLERCAVAAAKSYAELTGIETLPFGIQREYF